MNVVSFFQGKSCISSIVNKKLEWSVTGMSCSRVLLRAHPSLMKKSQLWSLGKPTSQWLSLQAMSNLMTWTYKSTPKQLLSKQLQASCKNEQSHYYCYYVSLWPSVVKWKLCSKLVYEAGAQPFQPQAFSLCIKVHFAQRLQNPNFRASLQLLELSHFAWNLT